VAKRANYRLAQVFVVGRSPTVTYNGREERELEAHVVDYIEERGRILMVTGPSKSGKTVLLRRMLPHAVWIAGGLVQRPSDLWQLIVDVADDTWTGELKEHARTDTESTGSGTTAQATPAGVGVGAQRSAGDAVSDASRHQRSVERSALGAAQARLVAADGVLVIDDFHHVEPDVQRIMVRQLKPLVDRGVGVVLVAVPHRAADVVAAEAEMDGRVEQLQIGHWEHSELMDIAHKGFTALGVDSADGVAERLVVISHGSPHLMQMLCRELCKANDVRMTAARRQRLVEPKDWDDFLSVAAVTHTSDKAYRALVQGPQARRDRVERRMRSSSQATDIYGALMLALGEVVPADAISYTTLRTALRDVLDEQPPKQQVTNALRNMTRIAATLAHDDHGRLQRDPILEWRNDTETLYVTDPFFAFRLCFGPTPLRGASVAGAARRGEERTPIIEEPQE
jgi:hypothetical protein